MSEYASDYGVDAAVSGAARANVVAQERAAREAEIAAREGAAQVLAARLERQRSTLAEARGRAASRRPARESAREAGHRLSGPALVRHRAAARSARARHRASQPSEAVRLAQWSARAIGGDDYTLQQGDIVVAARVWEVSPDGTCEMVDTAHGSWDYRDWAREILPRDHNPASDPGYTSPVEREVLAQETAEEWRLVREEIAREADETTRRALLVKMLANVREDDERALSMALAWLRDRWTARAATVATRANVHASGTL